MRCCPRQVAQVSRGVEVGVVAWTRFVSRWIVVGGSTGGSVSPGCRVVAPQKARSIQVRRKLWEVEPQAFGMAGSHSVELARSVRTSGGPVGWAASFVGVTSATVE